MKELIEALEAILQKGIVVEPVAAKVWGTPPGFLIRLATEKDTTPEEPVIGGLGR